MNHSFKISKFNIQEKDKKDLIANLPKFKGKKVLIIGDVGLDEYVLGKVRRISPEAPVPVLEVEQEDQRLGLAANVAQNVASLGGEAVLLGVVGKDTGAQMLKNLFHKNNIRWDSMIEVKDRPTTRKTRVMSGHHHIVRVDYELRKYLAPETENQLLESAQKLISSSDVVILQDYAKGVISEKVVKAIADQCKKSNKLLLVDPHRMNAGEFYFGVDLIKPNFEEAIELSGLNFDDLRDVPDKVYHVGKALQNKTGAKNIVLTQGKEGMTIFSGNEVTEVPTYARKVFDVTGAGDTVIAALALGLAGGLDLVHSCMLANYAAGVVVGKIGCVPCEIPELIDYISTPSHMHLE